MLSAPGEHVGRGECPEEARTELIKQALDVLTRLVMALWSTRESVRRWHHLRALCSLLFHPEPAVRRGAALCLSHLALASERIKASAYRAPELVAVEEDVGEEATARSAPAGAVRVPEVFHGKLCAGIPTAVYKACSAHGQTTMAHPELVARALDRMEHVEQERASEGEGQGQGHRAAAQQAAGHAGVNRQLLALKAEPVVRAALDALDAARSHAEFLREWEALVNLCAADAGLTEAFFLQAWDSAGVTRLLQTRPTSAQDEQVLEAVLDRLCLLLGAVERGRVVAGKTLRFLLQAVKLYLLPLLRRQKDKRAWAGGGLRRRVIELVAVMLEHDQCAGAHLVTPVLQAYPTMLVTLAELATATLSVPSAEGAHGSAGCRDSHYDDEAATRVDGEDAVPIAVKALECLQMLTRDAHDMAGFGAGGEGGVGAGQVEELFEGVVQPLTQGLVSFYRAEASAPDRAGVEGGVGGTDAPCLTFQKKGGVRLSLEVLVQVCACAEVGRRWRRTYVEFADTRWLLACRALCNPDVCMRARRTARIGAHAHMRTCIRCIRRWLLALLRDRETMVRSHGFSLIGAVAISLVDPSAVGTELRHVTSGRGGEGGDGGGGNLVLLVRGSIVRLCLSCCMDACMPVCVYAYSRHRMHKLEHMFVLPDTQSMNTHIHCDSYKQVDRHGHTCTACMHLYMHTYLTGDSGTTAHGTARGLRALRAGHRGSGHRLSAGHVCPCCCHPSSARCRRVEPSFQRGGGVGTAGTHRGGATVAQRPQVPR